MIKRSFGLRDFSIDADAIPAAKPARLRDGSWGVLLTHDQMACLRNHMIVQVTTKGGKEWFARLDGREDEDETGVYFSIATRRIDLAIEAEAKYLQYRQRLVDVAQGALFPASDRIVPDQNERVYSEYVKAREVELGGRG